jgi:hypothetical protein
MTLRARFLASLLAIGVGGSVSVAEASSGAPMRDAKPATTGSAEASAAADGDAITPAARYVGMDDDEALRELTRRGIVFERLGRIPGVRTPVRLATPLHGVLIRSSLPPEERTDSMFEILDARLALALDDFAVLLESHDVVELVHYTMYRPNGPKPTSDEHDHGHLESKERRAPTRHPAKGKDGEAVGKDEPSAPASEAVTDKPSKPTETEKAAKASKPAKKEKTAKKAASKKGKTKKKPASKTAAKIKGVKDDGTKVAKASKPAKSKPVKAPAAPTEGLAEPKRLDGALGAESSLDSALASGETSPAITPAAAKPAPVEAALAKGAPTEGRVKAEPRAARLAPTTAEASVADGEAATPKTDKPRKRHAKHDKAVKGRRAARAEKAKKAKAAEKAKGADKAKGVDSAKGVDKARSGEKVPPKGAPIRSDEGEGGEDARLEIEPSLSRTVAYAAPGTRHPAGLAIDVGMLRKSDGRLLSIANHFGGRIGANTCGSDATLPSSAEGRELWSIVCEAKQAGIFSHVLTPNYDAAHVDHLHMEIKPGSRLAFYR